MVTASLGPTLAISALILSALVSGCVGGDDPQPQATGDAPAGPAAFSETTGGIEGAVLDEEGLPLPGAQVALGEGEKTTTTDDSGAFSFGNLEPGTYPIFVQRLGFESAAKSIAVEAGAVATLTIELVQLRVSEPFTLTYTQDGLVGCGVSVRPVVGVAVCGVLGLQGVVNTSQYDMFLLRWELPEPTEPWMTGIFETYWQSSQTLGRGLSVNWEIEDCPNNNDVTFADQVGQSPLYSYVDKDKIDEVIQNAADGEGCNSSAERCNEEFCRIYSRTFATAETTGQAVDVGVVFQQRYSQIVTAFYHEQAPADYSALPDA